MHVSVCVLICVARGGALKLAVCFQPAGKAACASWRPNTSREKRAPFAGHWVLEAGLKQ